MAGPADGLLTAKEVARRLAVSPRRVHQLALPKVRLGARLVRYRPEDVTALVVARTEVKESTCS
jgi:predicted DNA-binding transcriptional regulator AlpA